jgi:DHA2 family multidrug resistance protein
MAPFIVRLTPIVGAKRLIFIGFLFLAVAMWHLSHLSLSADYGVFARARMLQGFGLGFLIVPISQVAYSYLPLEQNNKASSLTNLFRKQTLRVRLRACFKINESNKLFLDSSL